MSATGSVVDRSLTRRGWTAVAVAAGCFGLTFLLGSREGAVNAVVVLLLLAVLAAVVTVRRASPPTVERRVPGADSVGGGGTVDLDFDPETPTTGVVEDRVGEGLAAVGSSEGLASGSTTDVGRAVGTREAGTIDRTHRVATTVTEDTRVSYGVAYRARGRHEVGPLSVAVEDVLGLARTRFEYDALDEVTVYPRVHEVAITRSRLASLAGGAPDREREQFDRLREYVPGDDLRDVHWRSSAKRPGDDLVVEEFLAEDDVETVTVGVEAAGERVDRAAEVAASVVVHLLGAGLDVTLFAGEDEVDGAGPRGRHRMLARLAVLEAGTLDAVDRGGLDVHVDARGEPRVRVGPLETTAADLLGASPARPTGDDEGDGTRAAADGGRTRGGRR